MKQDDGGEVVVAVKDDGGEVVVVVVEDDGGEVNVVVEKDDDAQEGPDDDRLVDGDCGGLGGVPPAQGHRQCLRMLSSSNHN